MTAEDFKKELSTRFAIPPSQDLDYNSRLFFLGSCFSENMGLRFQQLFFQCCINPFGILYNPVSLAQAIEKMGADARYLEQDLFYFNGLFHSLDHHGTFHHASASALLQKINTELENGRDFLKQSSHILITLGTSFVHTLEADNRIVANCHKIPATEFNKRILSETEIIDALNNIKLTLKRVNPGAKVIFTLSPVKHLREGIQENALSKSRLLSALHAFLHLHADAHYSYFPAYEIVTEELRDHRFYTEDLAHPSNWTLAYIFQRFTECKLTPSAIQFIEPAIKYLRMKNHRVMSENSAEQDKWNQTVQAAFEKLRTDFPNKIWE